MNGQKKRVKASTGCDAKARSRMPADGGVLSRCYMRAADASFVGICSPDHLNSMKKAALKALQMVQTVVFPWEY